MQTQVLPYLREIAEENIKVSLLTFEPDFKEKWTAAQIKEAKAKLADEKIDWYCLPYHKRPSVPATLFDVLQGARFARKMIRENGVNVLHARVHVPALMASLAKKSNKNVKLLFDIRGFMPEEYTDGGMWKPNGALYRNVKKVERWLFKNSDAFVVLTEKAREILFPESVDNTDRFGRPLEVIPCCVDLERFKTVNQKLRNETRVKLNIENRSVLVYVGSFGGFYMARETADFYGAAKRRDPNTFALILTQTPKEMIQPLLEERGFTAADFFIQKVAPNEVPAYLSAGDAAVSFIKPCYSKLSSSPTKNAEYLACGLPLIANSGVGDVKEHTEADRVGFVIDEFDEQNYEKALSALEELKRDGDLANRCRASAKKRFDLKTVGGIYYKNIYSRLLRENKQNKV